MKKPITTAVIIAHPDDETLWAGGTILTNPMWDWYIITLCRKSDPERAPKFNRVLEIFGAKGDMGDLDDVPDQRPLDGGLLKTTILQLLPEQIFQKKYQIITETYGFTTNSFEAQTTTRAEAFWQFRNPLVYLRNRL